MGHSPSGGEFDLEDAYRRPRGQHALDASRADALARIVDQMQLSRRGRGQKPFARIAKKRRHVVRQPEKAIRFFPGQLSLKSFAIFRGQGRVVRAARNRQSDRQGKRVASHLDTREDISSPWRFPPPRRTILTQLLAFPSSQACLWLPHPLCTPSPPLWTPSRPLSL